MGQGIAINNDDTFSDPSQEFALQQAQLARRRELAQKMIAEGMKGNSGSGYHGGRVFIVGNPLGNIAQGIAGNYLDSQATKGETELAAKKSAAQADWMAQRPDGTDPRAMQDWLQKGNNMGLRTQLEQQFQKADQDRIEKGEQAAAQRVETAAEKQANRDFLEAQKDLDRKNQIALRQMPTQHISISNSGGNGPGFKVPAGYMMTPDGTGLIPVPGGPADPNNPKATAAAEAKANAPVKLTAAQQKAYDDSDVLLGHIDNALQQIELHPNAIGYKTVIPDMALSKIDPEGVGARAAVSGLSAEKVHTLSGAAVSPAEFARLRPYLPASGDTADAAKQKLTNLRAEVERIKAAHARGPTMANPKATQAAPAQQPTVTPQQQSQPVRRKYNPATGMIE